MLSAVKSVAPPGTMAGRSFALVGAVRAAVLDSNRTGHHIQRSVGLAPHFAPGRLATLRFCLLQPAGMAAGSWTSASHEVFDARGPRQRVRQARESKGCKLRDNRLGSTPFRNALIAPITYAMILLAGFMTGTVVVETVFAWPGIGRLAVNAALNTDFPLVTGLALVFGMMFLAASLVADVLYGVLDPRIRYE